MSAALQTTTTPAPASTLRLDARRKLIPIEFLAVFHGLDVRDALILAEEGAIYPVFNLATVTSGRRKLHVWRATFEQFEPGRTLARPKVETVIAGCLPPLGIAPAASVTIRGRELQLRWCLSYQRVMDWVKAGELREVGKHNPVKESPKINFASAAAFLERRLV